MHAILSGIIDFAVAALNDENGVNAIAYNQLQTLFSDIKGMLEDGPQDNRIFKNISDITTAVKSADGRFYLPSDFSL